MKKVDFHIHTQKSFVDSAFELDVAKLKEYTEKLGLDAIAITNHNLFDLQQFRTITHELDIIVLPGIELNLGKGHGHALMISDNTDIEDFALKCSRIFEICKTHDEYVSVAQLQEIYGDLSKYLIIPHYDKHPPVDSDTLKELGSNFIAGEVTSAKKFMYAQKNADSPTPMLFSDSRAKSDWAFTTRQTFLDIDEVNIASIKMCLSDKSKVSLSAEDGNELIQVTPSGVLISSGLTVLLGGRSSGKSYTLDEIENYTSNVKYIRQFDLIEQNPETAAKEFNERVGQKQDADGEVYLRKFSTVVEDVRNISLESDDFKVGTFVSSLLKAADEAKLQDEYSKAILFSETPFQILDSEKLKNLIEAVTELLNPGVYEPITDKHIEKESLKSLHTDLVETLWREQLDRKKSGWVNTVVSDIKFGLGSSSAATQVKDVDLWEIAKNKKKIQKFEEIVGLLQQPRIIVERDVQQFKIQESTKKFMNAQELKDFSHRTLAFSDAYAVYGKPYEYLKVLKAKEELEPASLYKYFVKIKYDILNRYGVPVSGGERAEFKLINEIDGAAESDLLLIDEPESSFDNLFLSGEVNQVIKNIAANTPVVVVTHNSTVGASVKPNYILYTERKIIEGVASYAVYSGFATSKTLIAKNGDSVSNNDITLKYLEAGKDKYDERNRMYEMLEN